MIVLGLLAVAALTLALWENVQWRRSLDEWGASLDREKVLSEGLLALARGVDEPWAYEAATATLRRLNYADHAEVK